MPPQAKPHIWAFDVGKASLGEAVRQNTEFIHAESWLIPEDLARRGPATSPGTPANRYRAWRTREAHLAREQRLREVLADAGVEVLQPKRIRRVGKVWETVHPGDERLTREFPAKGDNTCYTSCLLRIKLLRGDKLESWQIHKALHSAIQRRGYDTNPPWQRRTNPETDSSESKEEGETKQRVGTYKILLQQIAPNRPEFQYPSYFEAWRLGLWRADRPNELSLRIDHKTEPARNRDASGIPSVVAPRELVIAETQALIEAASRHFPKLAGQADFILHGPGRKPYASYDAALRNVHGLREGGANDWLGILGQKVPRFDNRIIAKCALISRLNVCKAEVRRDPNGQIYPESLLVAEVTFLLKLKNIQVQRSDKRIGMLTAEEIRNIFENPRRSPEKLSFTETQWKKICVTFGALPAPGHEEIKAAKTRGRSRFCRPALQILRRLILSGEAPKVAYDRELTAIAGNTNPKKGLVTDDLEFLRRMGESWETLYVPDQQHDALLHLREQKGRDASIRALIGAVKDPVVRHRLETFWTRLVKLEKRFGVPDEVALEFVRDDFLGDNAKRELQKFQKQREKARSEARAAADQLGAAGRAAALKYELLKQQGGICLYTGASLGQTQLDEFEIEHIVPRSKGGPDAVINYVVTTRAVNDAKGDRTPYEWFADQNFQGWDAYTRRVDSCMTALRRKKVLLLTSPNALELVNRYTALAETAWIARLTQTLVALFFGWPVHSQTGKRHITIISGGLTARVRRRYRLNSLLYGPCPDHVDPLDWEEECDKKNRNDKRHHALDAMVLSLIPGWARNPTKTEFFRMPDGIARETFAQSIAKVFARPLAYEKPRLADTAYAMRAGPGEKDIITQRVLLKGLAYKKENMREVFSLATARKQAQTIRDPVIRDKVVEFLQSNITENEWSTFCDSARINSNGSKVRKVSVFFGEPDEFKNLAKGESNRYSGIWKKRFKSHRGQYIYLDSGVPKVRPVYAFESPYQSAEALKQNGFTPLMFVQSGCLMETQRETSHTKQPLPPGLYQLNTVRADGYVQLTMQDGTTYTAKPKPGERSIPLYKLSALLTAGFRRIN